MSDLTEFQYKLSQIHLDLYHLWLDIDTTDEEAEVVDKILEVFHGAWKAVPIPESLITEAKEIMQLAQDNREYEEQSSTVKTPYNINAIRGELPWLK